MALPSKHNSELLFLTPDKGRFFFPSKSHKLKTGDNIWRSQNPTAPASGPAKAPRALRYLGTNGIYTCGNQLLKSVAVTINPPVFTLKPNTRKQERTKGKMAFCATSECWWEGHSLSITKTTENQTASTGDKTNTVQEDRAPLLHQDIRPKKEGTAKLALPRAKKCAQTVGVLFLSNTAWSSHRN